VTLAVLALALAGGCGHDAYVIDPGGPAVALTALTYNVFRVDGGEREGQVASVINAAAPDVVAVQECLGCEELADALGMTLVAPPREGVAILYDAGRWRLEDDAAFVLGENDDGWGTRWAAVAVLAEEASGRTIVVYSTHFCVTVRKPDDACDEARQIDYVERILDDLAARSDGPAIIAGDLNVFDGFEDGRVVERLRAAGLVDTYRAAQPDGEGTTFQGSDVASSGRIDYVFARAPAVTFEASVRVEPPAEEASDHFAVAATVEFPAAE
jgi:endonuclease/exonuclease/phosphatase family metal-dependent hydrolase